MDQNCVAVFLSSSVSFFQVFITVASSPQTSPLLLVQGNHNRDSFPRSFLSFCLSTNPRTSQSVPVVIWRGTPYQLQSSAGDGRLFEDIHRTVRKTCEEVGQEGEGVVKCQQGHRALRKKSQNENGDFRLIVDTYWSS